MKVNSFQLSPWRVHKNDQNQVMETIKQTESAIKKQSPLAFDAIMFDLFDGSKQEKYEHFEFQGEMMSIQSPFIIFVDRSGNKKEDIKSSYIKMLRGLFIAGLIALKLKQEEEIYTKNGLSKNIKIYLFLLDKGSNNQLETLRSLRHYDCIDLIKQFDFGMYVQPQIVLLNIKENQISRNNVRFIRRLNIYNSNKNSHLIKENSIRSLVHFTPQSFNKVQHKYSGDRNKHKIADNSRNKDYAINNSSVFENKKAKPQNKGYRINRTGNPLNKAMNNIKPNQLKNLLDHNTYGDQALIMNPNTISNLRTEKIDFLDPNPIAELPRPFANDDENRPVTVKDLKVIVDLIFELKAELTLVKKFVGFKRS